MKLPLMMTLAMLALGTTGAQNDKHPHGIDPSNMNLKAKPGTNFFEYANGGWNKKHPLTAEYSRYGVFNMLYDNNNERIRTLIEEMAKSEAAEGTLQQKIGTIYNKVLDSERLNADGIKPLLKNTAPIDAIQTRPELIDAVATLGRSGLTLFFSYGAEADAKDSKMNLVEVAQGGLTLGPRDYYLDTDSATMNIRNAYREFGRKLFAKLYPQAGQEEVNQKMDNVLLVETSLANAFKSRTELRIPENNYHKISYPAFQQTYTAVNWDRFFQLNGFPAFGALNVAQPEALKRANDLLANEKLEILKDYVIFRMSVRALPYLSDELRGLHFDFFSKTMSGTEQEQPAWKRGVELANGLMGEAIGKIYAEKYFPEAAKKRMETLVKNLQVALGERIKEQDWMSEETKQKALGKLATFYVKIGYPDKWREWDGLKVDSKAPLLDIVNAINLFNNDYYTAKTVGKPVDRDQWYMTPQTVNAYYNPPTNEICFPAGILQYPFFDMEADDAFNYGAIGVVIGHEMTHGFDDQGRKYDQDGNMVEWWDADDSRRFNERTQVMVNFFNNIKVLPDLNSNGQLTLGENLADHGGLQVAYAAFKNATKGEKPKKVGGFTPDQRFFLAYAGVWAGDIREAEIRKRVKTDPHSLGKWRVNGQVPHIDAWYDAFRVTPADPLFVPKEKRVTIW